MALPRKISRKIVVDWQAYRWTTCQSIVGDNGFGITLIVEVSGQKNPRIFDRPVFLMNTEPPWDKWYQAYQDDSPVLPGQVETVIKSAISQGWAPSIGKDFESSILYELILNNLPNELSNQLRRHDQN